jgi:hypothetical protein
MRRIWTFVCLTSVAVIAIAATLGATLAKKNKTTSSQQASSAQADVSPVQKSESNIEYSNIDLRNVAISGGGGGGAASGSKTVQRTDLSANPLAVQGAGDVGMETVTPPQARTLQLNPCDFPLFPGTCAASGTFRTTLSVAYNCISSFQLSSDHAIEYLQSLHDLTKEYYIFQHIAVDAPASVPSTTPFISRSTVEQVMDKSMYLSN